MPERFNGLPFRAVLWDVDGTLADSEPVHELSFKAACERFELTLQSDFHESLIGQDDATTHGFLAANFGLDVSLQCWQEYRIATYLDCIDQVVPFASAVSLWHRLDRAGLPQATVSNSERRVVDANLRQIRIDRPGLISVSRDDVQHGKPSPEPYLLATELLGLSPPEVVVVEDSASGLQSAQQAGMRVYMMPWFESEDTAEIARFRDLEHVVARNGVQRKRDDVG